MPDFITAFEIVKNFRIKPAVGIGKKTNLHYLWNIIYGLLSIVNPREADQSSILNNLDFLLLQPAYASVCNADFFPVSKFVQHVNLCSFVQYELVVTLFIGGTFNIYAGRHNNGLLIDDNH